MPHRLNRENLEEAWRLMLEGKQEQYRTAREHFATLLKGLQDGISPDLEGAMAQASQAESQALTEYVRVLQIFTELTVHGKVPEETLDREAYGMNGLGLDVISVVDDDESVRAATKALLRSAGYDVKAFASAQLFLESGAERDSACLILDLRMPETDGLELQHRLKAAGSKLPVIFISAYDDLANRQKAMEAGAVDFFRKPFNGNSLLRAIETVLPDVDAQSGFSALPSSRPNRGPGSTSVGGTK
jgi:CheY-like chemotaxis protein